jgi:predicted small lipoprotein YifL
MLHSKVSNQTQILIVKPAFALPAAAVLAALLAGCGQPGPLYMPPPLKGGPAAQVPAPATPPENAPASAVPTSGRAEPGNLPTPVSSSPAPTPQ